MMKYRYVEWYTTFPRCYIDQNEYRPYHFCGGKIPGVKGERKAIPQTSSGLIPFFAGGEKGQFTRGGLCVCTCELKQVYSPRLNHLDLKGTSPA